MRDWLMYVIGFVKMLSLTFVTTLGGNIDGMSDHWTASKCLSSVDDMHISAI